MLNADKNDILAIILTQKWGGKISFNLCFLMFDSCVRCFHVFYHIPAVFWILHVKDLCPSMLLFPEHFELWIHFLLFEQVQNCLTDCQIETQQVVVHASFVCINTNSVIFCFVYFQELFWTCQVWFCTWWKFKSVPYGGEEHLFYQICFRLQWKTSS